MNIRSITLSPGEDAPYPTRVKRNVPMTAWLGGTIEDINTYFAEFVPAGWKIVAFSEKMIGDVQVDFTE